MNDDMNNKSRQFVCACSKTYLSYAALFTHIKQKHEGKAPGPITRPRSQRKRGRPRKNLHLSNSLSNLDQEELQNGIIKGIDINNNNQKQEKQQKTKKAAQMLGCKSFAAFTAYKPDPAKPTIKLEHDSNKKNAIKKNNNQTIDKKHLTSFNFINTNNQQNKYGTQIYNSQPREDVIDFCYNFQLTNKNQLKKIFQIKCQEEKQILIKCQDFLVYKQLNVSQENISSRNINIGLTPINVVISEFLREIKNTLSAEHETKVDQSNSQNEEGSSCHNSDYEQSLLFIVLLLDGFVQHVGIKTSQLSERSLLELQIYLQKFVLNDLPQKIIQNNLQNKKLFKGINPTKFILYLCNWLVLRKTQYQLSKSTSKLQNELENGAQHQEQIKFKNQQFNQKQSQQRLIRQCLQNGPTEFKLQDK